MNIEIVLPPQDRESALSVMLVEITKAIDALDPDRVAHGFLGGQHGYGGHWDSPVFQMRPFCWCEEETCPWCCGCDCPETAFHYFVDGVEVSHQEWSDFFDRETYQKLSGGKVRNFSDSLEHREARYYTHNAWMAAAKVANKRRETRQDEVCAFCRGEFPPPETGAIKNRKGAPNFWHKASGLRVWWYKYIGRGMETDGGPSDLTPIFAECLEDIAARAASAMSAGTAETAKQAQGEARQRDGTEECRDAHPDPEVQS